MKRTSTHWIAAGFVSLMAAFCSGVRDGDVLWSDMPIADDYLYGARSSHSAVSDGGGGIIAVWQEDLQYPESHRIKAQRLNALGQQMWSPAEGVLVTSKDTSYSPAAVPDGSGGVIIAWEHHGTGAYGVYCQRLNASGQALWAGDVRVSTSPLTPVICKDGYGGAVVGFGRRAAHVNASGVVTTGVDGIEIIPAGMGDSFALTDSFGNSLYAAWASPDGKVYARRLDGALPWGPTPTLVSSHAAAYSVSAAAPSDGGVLICWWARDGAFPGRTTIRVQSLTPTGSARWPSGGVVVLDSDGVGGDWYAWSAYFGRDTAIAHDAAGGCFAAWMDYRIAASATLDTAVFAQRVNSAGLPQWKDNGLYLTDVQAAFTWGRSRQPSLLPDGWGGIIAVFESLHWNWPYEYDYAIYATHLNRGGVQLWRDWISYDDYGRDLYRPRLVYDASGPAPTGALIAWSAASESLHAAKVHLSPVPHNDLCSDAKWIGPGSHPGTTLGASNDGQTLCGVSSTTADVWFRYRPASSTEVAIDTCTADFDTVVSIHAGCPGTPGNTLFCNDDCADLYFGCAASRSSCLRFSAVAGTDYYIRVSGYNGATGNFVLTLTEFTPSIPDNDGCADARLIGPGSYVGSTYYAVPDGQTICGLSDGSPDVWYRYTPAQTTWVNLDTCVANFDTVLSVHGDCAGTAANTLFCNDDCADPLFDCSSSIRSCVRFAARQGTDYLIRVSGFRGAKGDFVLTLTEAGPPNDDCEEALAIQEGVFTFSTVGATSDGPPETRACGYLDWGWGSDIWYRYTAGCSGWATVSLRGSDFDTLLAVYGQACPGVPGRTIACNDDWWGLQSQVSFFALAGREYLIRIDGYSGSQGWGILDVSFSPAEITGDCIVSLYDFAQMARGWLEEGCMPPTWCGRADMTRSSRVDLSDLAVFCEDWLAAFEMPAYEDLNAVLISAMEKQMSDTPIDASDGNVFNPGTYIVYQTSQGRPGKLLVQKWEPAAGNQLTIAWTTYQPDGSVYSSGSGLMIPGTYLCDLDSGQVAASDADFLWQQMTGELRQLSPANNARFLLLYRAP